MKKVSSLLAPSSLDLQESQNLKKALAGFSHMNPIPLTIVRSRVNASQVLFFSSSPTTTSLRHFCDILTRSLSVSCDDYLQKMFVRA
mmetsp:Transcript_28462/g.44088  ORF Transcript_28462/g.44088 Transcript_28462/m.44088 type:complete len:87 (-) Transcript_28462:153-413(-)